jgi:hypothetical protein
VLKPTSQDLTIFFPTPCCSLSNEGSCGFEASLLHNIPPTATLIHHWTHLAKTAAVPAAAAAFPTCRILQWTGTQADFAGLDKIFPDALLQFVRGGQLRLPAYRYMFQLSRKGTYCMAVFDNGMAGSLIGGVATRNVLVKVRQMITQQFYSQ